MSLLRQLVRRPLPSAVLLVLVEDDAGAVSRTVCAGCAWTHQTVPFHPLSRAALASMVAHMCHLTSGVPPAVLSRLWDAAGGVPSCLLHCLRHLYTLGVLAFNVSAGAWEFAVDRLPLFQCCSQRTVADVLSQLSSFERDTRLALCAAALHGSTVPLAEVVLGGRTRVGGRVPYVLCDTAPAGG